MERALRARSYSFICECVSVDCVLWLLYCCLCVCLIVACLMFGLSVVWVLCCCVWCGVVLYILLTCQVSNLLQNLSGFVRRFDTCLSLCMFRLCVFIWLHWLQWLHCVVVFVVCFYK